jgi:hypothetical protein
MNREWKDGDHGVHYYYGVNDGRIVGQTHNIAHTKVWVAKVIHSHNDEHYLGQYINLSFAMRAIETFWEIQERTLLDYNVGE